MVGVSETIVVSDTPVVRPAVMIDVSENIAVTDSPGVTLAPPDLELFFAEPINPIMVENGFQLSFHIALANRGTTPFLGPLPVSGTLPVGVTLSFLPPFCSATTAREYTCTYLDFAIESIAAGLRHRVFDRRNGRERRGARWSARHADDEATLTTPGDPNPQNNTDSIEFTVTDVTPPVISACAPPLTVWSNLAGLAAIPDMRSAVQATDNWPGSLTILQDPPAGTIVGVGTHAVEIFVYDAQQNGNICQTSVVVQRPTVTLNLPGNVTLVASSPNGAVFPYQVTATDGPVTFEPFCTPQLFPGMFFPIGTTTVSCIAFGPVSLSAATGSFTVTVVVGTPKLSVAVGPIFRQPNGKYLVNLFVTNIGTGHARNVSLNGLRFRTLAGAGNGQLRPRPLGAAAESRRFDRCRPGANGELLPGGSTDGCALLDHRGDNASERARRRLQRVGRADDHSVSRRVQLRRTGMSDQYREEGVMLARVKCPWMLAIVMCVAGAPAAHADPFTFTLLPTGGAISGEPGGTIGWGYSLTNDSLTDWLMLTNIDSDPFADVLSADASPFDFPILAPGETRSVAFNPATFEGLFQLTWDPLAADGTTNLGAFVLSAEFWDGDPLVAGTFLASADPQSALYSATVVAPVPEPGTLALMTTGAGIAALVRRRRRTRAAQ